MSVDIKSTYGAVGDGQLQTLTVTFANGSGNLRVFSNTFSGADVTTPNKKIAVQGWVAADGSNPLGSALANITAVGSFASGHQDVTLDVPAQLSATAANKLVDWGTDDTAAVAALNTAQAGNSNVVLTVPAGRYCGAKAGASSLQIGNGILSLTVNGTGGPTFSDMLGVGSGWALNFNGSPLFNDNLAESLVQTVAAGATVLHMVTAADAAKYTVGDWSWMTGFDVQGFGTPPNPFWAEFVQITAKDSVAGTVTIASPLKNSYKSTWPKWGFGTVGPGAPTYAGDGGVNGLFSLGGPATLYLIKQGWNGVQTWNGVNFGSYLTLLNCTARRMIINNATFESFGPNVSFQQSFSADNITVPALWELDKGSENFTLTNSTVRSFMVQNPSPFNVVLDNVTVQTNSLSATTKRWTARNCSFQDSISFGPSAYGVGEYLNISNSSLAGQTIVQGLKEGDITGAGAYSMSGGVITRLRSGGTGAPPQWAIPGNFCFFGSRFNYEDPGFRVLDVYTDGTTLFIPTDQAGGFPSVVSPATQLNIITAPPPNFTFTNCTGCDDAVSWSAVTPSKPLYSQWKRTYSGNIGAINAAHQIKIAGQLVSIKITVNAGYSAGTFNLGGPGLAVIKKPANVIDTSWDPQFDLTMPGVRTIHSDGTVTGTAGADSGLVPQNSGNIWLVDNQFTAAMSGAVGSGSVTLEITTDQGISLGRAFVCNFQ